MKNVGVTTVMMLMFACITSTTAQRGQFPDDDVELPGAVQINPKFIDFAYEPELRRAPGVDFLGWGYDATYRDQFYALKPALFRYSYNNNPKGSEKFYQYPIDDEQYAVPDQVFIRTVGKTTTATTISNDKSIDRMRLDLKINLKASTAQFEGSLSVGVEILDESTNEVRIVRSEAQTELYQLYLGKRFLSTELEFDMLELTGVSYSSEPAMYNLFLSTWGTHYVDSVSVGGSVVSVVEFETSEDIDSLKVAVALAGKFEDSTGTKVEGDLSLDFQQLKQNVKENTTATSNIMGGDPKFTDFVLRADNPESAATLYESWKSTLMDNPVAVRFRLVETWQLYPVLLDNPQMGLEVCTATSVFLQFFTEDPEYCSGVPEVLSSYVRGGGLAKGETNSLV